MHSRDRPKIVIAGSELLSENSVNLSDAILIRPGRLRYTVQVRGKNKKKKKIDVRWRAYKPLTTISKRENEVILQQPDAGWFYLGTFRGQGQQELLPAEFACLSQKTKDAVIRMTAGKTTDAAVMQEISNLYSMGYLHAHRINLQLMGNKKAIMDVLYQSDARQHASSAWGACEKKAFRDPRAIPDCVGCPGIRMRPRRKSFRPASIQIGHRWLCRVCGGLKPWTCPRRMGYIKRAGHRAKKYRGRAWV
ncbi:hypothetical protein EW146_g3248 [Bondarzewia mesenterica]|uniref:Uncharacterized protein n=1 Tax=Bondarzewia mesenterica TaxID=1095465 RepID=A0A4S4LZL7_9AGAM|nr:hypothetical protein EW146_g3248 [Bondarzewia mesenterica]